MGLHIQSLKNIPENVHRDYFIYLLDYGWDEPLGEVLKKNFDKMARIAAENNAVVILGMDRVHFEDEVFSWHSINGENADELLPAILITNRHPSKFRESYGQNKILKVEEDLKMILVPLKKFCTSITDVVNLIQKIFRDIQDQKPLNNFAVEKELKRGIGNAVADALILQPNISGVGFDFKKVINYFRKK